MSKLDDLVATNPIPSWRGIAYTVIVVISGLLVWAYFSTLPQSASVDGFIQPEGAVKVVQHLEGGIVQELFVREGNTVTEGQPLMQLQLGTQSQNREELSARLDGLFLSQARLKAEASGQPLAFPADLEARRPDLTATERRTYEARQNERGSTGQLLQQQIQQRELEIKEFQSKKASLQRELGSVEQKFKIAKDLLKDGLTTRTEYLQLEQDMEKIKGEIGVADVAIPRTQAALREAQEKAREDQFKGRTVANTELGKIEQDIARTTELLQSASAQAQRTVVLSPVAGTIKKMAVNTIGGVVRPGDPIIEIVPSDQKLIIDAKLKPIDVGFVAEGQEALIKVSSFDFSRYGGVDGRVVRVAPDSTVDDKGNAFYRVIIEPDRNFIGNQAGEHDLKPGMMAQVNIVTGQQSVLDYLMKPVLKLRYESFTER